MELSFTQAVFAPSAQAVSCEIGGETVILDLASGKYFGLDPIGTRIWQWISTPSTLDALCGRLREEYNVSADRCAQDVSALLDELLKQGLVKLECSENSAA